MRENLMIWLLITLIILCALNTASSVCIWRALGMAEDSTVVEMY